MSIFWGAGAKNWIVSQMMVIEWTIIVMSLPSTRIQQAMISFWENLFMSAAGLRNECECISQMKSAWGKFPIAVPIVESHN